MGLSMSVSATCFCRAIVSDAARLPLSHERIVSDERRSALDSSSMKVKLWTWNSMKEDLSAEAADLFGSDADVIISCQTEAIKGIREYTDDSQWLLVSYGEHTGIAGGDNNGQILSVFFKQPADAEPYEATRPPESSWRRSGIGVGLAAFRSDYLMESAEVEGLLTTSTMIHQTSSSGKGGLSVDISWSSGPGYDSYRTTFLCAHLDSESEERRTRQFLQMFRDMRGLHHVSRTTLGQIPCVLWDAHTPECEQDVASKREAVLSDVVERDLVEGWLADVHEMENPLRRDLVVVLGDLNYRLSTEGLRRIVPFELNDTEPLLRLVSSAAGRDQMAIADPLSVEGIMPGSLIRSLLDGFGFHCNIPYREYPWTYKRRDPEQCVLFGRALRQCEEAQNTSACEEALVLGKLCYAQERDHHEHLTWEDTLFDTGELTVEWRWQEKGPDLQLGWLDRVCLRVTDGSALRAEFSGEESGWTEIGDSDHMAIVSEIVLTPPARNPRPVPGDSSPSPADTADADRRGTAATVEHLFQTFGQWRWF